MYINVPLLEPNAGFMSTARSLNIIVKITSIRCTPIYVGNPKIGLNSPKKQHGDDLARYTHGKQGRKVTTVARTRRSTRLGC